MLYEKLADKLVRQIYEAVIEECTSGLYRPPIAVVPESVGQNNEGVLSFQYQEINPQQPENVKTTLVELQGRSLRLGFTSQEVGPNFLVSCQHMADEYGISLEMAVAIRAEILINIDQLTNNIEKQLFGL